MRHYKNALNIAKAHFNLEEELVVLDHVIKCKVNLAEYESLAKQVAEALGTLNQVPTDRLSQEFRSHYIQK